MENTDSDAVRVEHLDKSFPNVKAVSNVSFRVKKGTLYSLLGPNGAGKTTTLNILSCNLLPDSGDAFIAGFSVSNSPKEVQKYIGICPQENILYDHLTVYENLLFFGNMYEMCKGVLEKRADELIQKVGLQDKRNAQIKTLSGGQKRRVNLLTAIVHDPQIIFLDEPTAGLDPQTRRLLWDYIRELKQQGKTFILTTHYMDEADILSETVGIIDHGKLIAQDTPQKLKESIGKGDSLIFKLNGPPHAIQEVFAALLGKKEIIAFQEMIGELGAFRITALDGIGKIGKFVNHFLNQKISVEDIHIQANSLENVFLELTGRSLRE